MNVIQNLHQQAVSALNRRAYQQSHQYCLQILNRDQRFADAWFLMAMIAVEHGRVEKATGLIGKALERDADNSEYLAHMGKCFALKHDHVQALKYAKKAQSCQQISAMTFDTLGVTYSRIGLHKTAVSCFNKAVAVKSDNPEFYFNLATSLKFSGDFVAARAACEQAITLAPNFYKAHWALAELGDISVENNHLKRLKVLLPQLKSPDDRLYLCHAIAKEYEALGNHECAFTYLAQGKSGKLKQIGDDFSHDLQVFTCLKQVFSKPFARSNEKANEKSKSGCASKAPIFIVGMPRTGTTLVERILSNHSNVITAGETQHFAQQLKQMVGIQSERLIDELTIEAATKLDFAKLGKAYIDATHSITAESPVCGDIRFIDKMPLNVLYVGFILKALPNAKIICLDRDPMDTIVSNYRQLFAANQGYYNYAYSLENTAKYYQQFQQLRAFWQRLYPDNFKTVSYERLVNVPEIAAKQVMAFCDLDWQPQCLDIDKNTNPVATASAVQVRSPIHNRSVGQWQKYKAFVGGVQEIINTP